MGSLAQTSGNLRPGVEPYNADHDQWLRRIASVVNGLLQGKSLNVGTVTLTDNAGTTTLTDARIGANTFIGFMPTTANASAEIGAGTLYVSARADGSATLTHANNSQTDRSFVYLIVG